MSDPNQAASNERRIQTIIANQAKLQAAVAEILRRPRSITEEIDALPGRRIVYTLAGDVSFTASNQSAQGTPISFQVSQDGPFVMTHYPLVSWWPNLPTDGDNYLKQSPVNAWPFPAQTDTGLDVLNLNYQLFDAGSQRAFQGGSVVSGQLLSRPGALMPLPVPTLWSPQALIQFIPYYLDIAFATAPSTDTTGGNLHVDLPGYRIVNL